ncbi:SDR family oxidoreductase [Lentzea flaviverrucosa]|uniref:Male sterility protein n=1 Tax=Lentzea flaviverrucosa TaxID=200379 RepID=A0A1H9HHB9_9PSEU|nr:SDR family oxidoreductase [Lentzea flaviverrucosa]RDI34588.1 male sterility protein [Lentzea flaviverrucosa]SEQ61743.1 Male sterility protein [Lentzea flaviverrucosa]
MSGLRVLVTGAAGLVGAEVTARLADEGHTVLALVHTRSEIVRNDGTVVRTVPIGQCGPGLVSCVAGDVTKPVLGLTAERYEELATGLDRVVHAAATTDFGRRWETYESLNVDGTRNVVRLAAERAVPLVHVSTAYVCGERTGRVLEDELDVGQRFGTGYERSKFLAEQEVRAAAVPAAVVRPSMIVGTQESGVIRDFKNMYVVLKLFTQGRVRSVPGFYDALLDLVPVDYVAALICQVVNHFDEARGRTFHAVGAAPHTLLDVSNALAEYPMFEVPHYVSPSAFDAGGLPPDERVYYRRIIAMYESFFRRRARFDDTNAARLAPWRPEATGVDYLRTLLDHCVRVGYLGRAEAGIGDVLRLAGRAR